MFRFATALLLVAVGVASAQRFAKHETIRALPEACQVSSGSNDWASSSQSRGGRGGSSNSYSTSSTTGPCKLLPPVMSEQGEGYEFCLKCKAGEKHGVTAETLAQSIRQVVERKLKRNNQFVQSRQAKLNLVIDGVKQPIDLTRVLANTPEVLEKVDDVFFFFPNGQIGRIEFEHGQPDELERITCRAPCRGGPRQTGSQQSSWSRKDQDIDEEEDQDNEPTYGSHSSSSTYQQKNKNKKYGASAYSYGEDSMTTPAYGQRSSSRYGSSSTYGQRSANAGRYGDNINKQRRYNSQHQEEEEDDK